ncbi:uncharacterized protein BYT42DRAFT_573915 [Radiomyces spectabilis]|uniref:uncharacterized protein n=1 Tax=Radiomyces spectabilis TaxID=64574 RepID=UPI002220427B|nr:uncharacterized protein BYT42DRAFT_573915 [Radiomyces spectabilis]KAI8376243.1 hypothetical protein BYT42DRAFT_573915 [Radiomyces spectabilis]
MNNIDEQPSYTDCHVGAKLMSAASPNPDPSKSDQHDDDDDDDNYDQFPDAAICECGRVLSSGWDCPTCRRNCPYCHRALSNSPEDYCDRCYRKCDQHGLYRIHDAAIGINGIRQCPQCAQHSKGK